MTTSSQSKKEVILGRAAIKESCRKVTLEEGHKIAQILIASLPKHAVGIAANQVGINSSVCYINANKPIVLINPTIIEANGKVPYVEGCLSFPNVAIKTQRYQSITVTADNHTDALFFDHKNLLECVCVQHEIDHLNGITMFDRKSL